MYKTLINKRKKIFTIIISVILVSILLISGCGKKEKEDVIKIGAILPLTGSASFLGVAEKNALNMAKNEINQKEKSNKKIELKIEDCKSTAKDGLNAFNKLKSQGIKFFIVSMTAVAKTTLPVSNRYNLLQFTLSADPNIAEKGNYTFRIYYGLDQEIKTILKYLKTKKIENIAALYLNTPEIYNSINNVLVNNAPQYNMSIVSKESFSFSTKDTKSLVAKIVKKNPDAIIVEDYGSVYPKIISNLDLYNFENKMIGGIGFLGIPPNQREIAQNITFVAPKSIINKTKKYKDFINKYQDIYKTQPPVPFDAILAYDNLNILINCLMQSDSQNPKTIRNTILSKGNFNGVIGKIRIDKNGRADFEATVGKYLNGEIVEVK